MTQQIDRQVIINAPPSAVWAMLTTHRLMKRWMAEPEMEIEIVTDWTVGSPIVIRGFHHLQFENTGRVLRFEPHQALRYSHLSSLSRLPDAPENYSIFDFRLSPLVNQTSLTLSVSNFPNEPIFKHLNFYWSVALEVMKRRIEKES